MLSWEAIIEQDNNGDDDASFTVLPETYRSKPDHNGICHEISYKFDDDDNTRVIRIEKKIQIMKKQQQISRMALKRKSNFVKFGRCSNIKRGTIERGVTLIHNEDFPFLFEDELFNAKTSTVVKSSVKKPSLNKNQENQNKKAGNLSMPIMLPFGKRTENKEEKKEKYKPWRLRDDSKYLPSDEIFEIRISNLPVIKLSVAESQDLNLQEIEQQEKNITSRNVRQLVNEFYQNILGLRPEARYRVYCFKTRRTQDMNAIVEFKRKEYQQMAIKHLHGHKYGYNILKVEESQPRKNRF